MPPLGSSSGSLAGEKGKGQTRVSKGTGLGKPLEPTDEVLEAE